MAETFAKFEQPLDFTQIIFKQINSCREAKNEEEYFKEVDTLYDLMFSYWENDEEFKKEMDTKGLKGTKNPYDNSSPEKLLEYYRNKFREIIKLIHRSGFLPHKEVEGVISAYDGEMLERLINLEKQGVKEI